MQVRTETYLDYELMVTVQEATYGWSWSYRIDDRITGIGRLGTEMPDADAALERAMKAARTRVPRGEAPRAAQTSRRRLTTQPSIVMASSSSAPVPGSGTAATSSATIFK